MASVASLAQHLATSSAFSIIEMFAMAYATVKRDKDAFSSKILPTKTKTLVNWILGDDQSIAVNKGVCNT